MCGCMSMALILYLAFGSCSVKSFLKLVRFLITVPGVKFFLGKHLYQDPIEKSLLVSTRGGGHIATLTHKNFCRTFR